MEHKPHDPDNRYTDEEYSKRIDEIQNTFYRGYLWNIRIRKFLNGCAIVLLLIVLYVIYRLLF